MFKIFMISLSAIFVFTQCNNGTKETTSVPQNKTTITSVDFPKELTRIEKTKEEWKTELSDFEYYVLRDKGTERPFTSPLLSNKKEGTYICKACDLPLFSSETKFKSGTGWPSFYAPIDSSYITEDTDYDIGYARTELTCTRCGGHLGHVFTDGPAPTGLRYCINGVSLDFVENK